MARARREAEMPDTAETPADDGLGDLRALVGRLAAERDEAHEDMRAAKLRYGAAQRAYMAESLKLGNAEHAADLARRAHEHEKAGWGRVGTLNVAGYGTVAASTVERRR